MRDLRTTSIQFLMLVSVIVKGSPVSSTRLLGRLTADSLILLAAQFCLRVLSSTTVLSHFQSFFEIKFHLNCQSRTSNQKICNKIDNIFRSSTSQNILEKCCPEKFCIILWKSYVSESLF